MRDETILKSKLVRPKVSNTIQRTRLLDLWDECKDKRLVTIVAGAGYGKTTLANRASRIVDVDTVWYRLDQGDSDFITFIRYLVAGIHQYYPDFGNETLHRLTLISSLKHEQQEVLNVFLSEIETYVDDHIVIVLDDYHLVDHSRDVNNAVEHLIANFSEWVHLGLISRKNPGIKLSRLRASRDICEITEKELAFSLIEIEQLFGEAFHFPLSAETVQELKNKTGGWVTGLILFYHSCRRKTANDAGHLLSDFSGASRDISSYLDENVYEQIPQDIQQFLLKTSILSRCTADFCNRFLSMENSEEILTMLEEKHLFVFSYHDRTQWFYYHQIFKDYLSTRFSTTFSKEEITAVHTSAAENWLDLNEPEEALNHYILAGNYDMACRLFDSIGRHFRYEGKLQKVHSLVRKIPESSLKHYPWILYNSGYTYDLLGMPSEAINTYEKALKYFLETNNEKGAGVCLNRLISNYGILGEFHKAETTIKNVLIQFKSNTSVYVTALGYLIMFLTQNHKLDEAEDRSREGLGLIDQPGYDSHRVWLYCTQAFYLCNKGEFGEALKLAREAESICEAIENHPVVFYVNHALAFIYYGLGRFDNGLKVAVAGIEQAGKLGFRNFNNAWLNVYACLNSVELDYYKEAEQFGQEAFECFRRCECVWGQAVANHALSIVAFASGRLDDAESLAGAAVNWIGNFRPVGYLGVFKSNLAIVRSEIQAPHTVDELFDEAERDLGPFIFYRFRLNVRRSKYFLKKYGLEASCDALEKALQIFNEKNYLYWITKETDWVFYPLLSLFSQNREKERIWQIILSIGPNVVQLLLELYRNQKYEDRKIAMELLKEIQGTMPKRLKVNCLGSFQVFLGDMEICNDFWTSQNAKTLFKYLSLNHDSGYISKERLQELLWPDEDPDKTINRLHVALNALRKTLEPSLPPRAESSFLLRKGDSYRLVFGDGGGTDTALFLSLLKKVREEDDPEQIVGYYLEAESLYRGDLFLEDAYADWCGNEKEMFRQEYCEVTAAIVDYYYSKGDITNGIRFASRLLLADPYSEKGYRQMMRLHTMAGNSIMVEKTFDQCCKRIEIEMDCPLSDETLEIYHSGVMKRQAVNTS